MDTKPSKHIIEDELPPSPRPSERDYTPSCTGCSTQICERMELPVSEIRLGDWLLTWRGRSLTKTRLVTGVGVVSAFGPVVIHTATHEPITYDRKARLMIDRPVGR